jgi:ribosomal peptide maturation radical SAM protein 1
MSIAARSRLLERKPLVALVCMPFLSTDRPSLGLSIIKSGIEKRGILVNIFYFNMSFAQLVGLETMEILDYFPDADLIKEWIFAESLWGKDEQRDEYYLKEVFYGGAWEHQIHKDWLEPQADYITKIWNCRHQAEGFINRCLEEVCWENYGIVGFSSIFQQQMASLALAKKIKEKYPHIAIVFGGVNCQGPMGATLLRNFSFIDAICRGDGDQVFPEFVSRFFSDKFNGDLPGIAFYSEENSHDENSNITRDMDVLPFPDFDDFFAQRASYEEISDQPSLLMAESSRGCWWGEKSQCTFCGLNGSSIQYRKKEHGRFLEEILWLLAKYGEHTREFFITDNIIPWEYLETFVPSLKAMNLEIKMFYETKANLKQSHIRLFSEAGIRSIQPGIESLSSPILKRMHKGVSALQNVQLLKWCLQYGIHPEWNYLIGFPGECAQDYNGQCELILSLTHLPPPHKPGIRRVRINRFSPYHSQPRKYNLKSLWPYRAYRYIYPGLNESDRENIAFYFVADYEGQADIPSYADDITTAMQTWLDVHSRSAMFYMESEDCILIYDFRPDTSDTQISLQGYQKQIYLACDGICSRDSLKRLIFPGAPIEMNDQELDTLLETLLEKKLLIEENQKYLALAIPWGYEYFPPEALWNRLDEVIFPLKK